MSTYRQLKQQIAELEKKATLAMKAEVKKVIESIKKQIAEFGLSAADLGLEVARRAGAKTSRARKAPLKPKYRDPVSGKTWNGHGKRPRWIVAAQAKGKLDDLLIEKAGRGKAVKANAKVTAKPAATRATKKAATAAKPAANKSAKKTASRAAPAAPAKRVAPKAAVRKAPRKAAPKKVPAPAAAPQVAPATA